MPRFRALHDHIPALRRYAFALLGGNGCADDADDLVQSCLLKAIDQFGTRAADRDIRPWLFSILHNLFISQWRRQRVRDRVMVEYSGADAIVPAAQADGIELADLLSRLDALPDDQRAVLLLVAVEGMSYAETAGILNIPVGTVMSRLSRARDHMARSGDEMRRPILRSVR